MEWIYNCLLNQSSILNMLNHVTNIIVASDFWINALHASENGIKLPLWFVILIKIEAFMHNFDQRHPFHLTQTMFRMELNMKFFRICAIIRMLNFFLLNDWSIRNPKHIRLFPNLICSKQFVNVSKIVLQNGWSNFS